MKHIHICVALLLLGSLTGLVQADTYILTGNQTIDAPTIADNGDTNAIVSSGTDWNYITGVVTVSGNSTINNSNRLNFQPDTTFVESGVGGYTLTKTGTGNLFMYGNATGLSQIISNEGTLAVQGNADAINAKNGVSINAGTLYLWNTAGVKGSVTMANGTTFQADGSSGATNSFVGDITLGGAVNIHVNPDVTLNTSGEITGAQNVSKKGSGTWVISGNANIGRLDLSDGAVTVDTGATLTGTQLLMRDGNANGTYTLNVNGGTVSFTGTDHRLGHWGNHTGVINLTDGVLNMSNNLSVGWDGTGKFYQSGGESTLNNVSLARPSSLIEISGGKSTISSLLLGQRGDGTKAATGTVTFKGDAELSIGNINAYRAVTLNIQDNALVHVTGSVAMGQHNDTYTAAINQTGGTVTIDGSLALGHYGNTTGNYTISNGTLNVLNYDASAGQSGLWLAVNGNGNLTQNGGIINVGRINLNARDDDFRGTYTMTAGTLNLGSGGIMATAAGANRYTINLAGGTITAGASALNGDTDRRSNWSSGLNANLTGTGDSRVTFAPESSYTITWSGAISGNGGLIKDGAGILKLAPGAAGNTYTGGTTVKSGEIQISGNNQGKSSIGTGQVTIESGATITALSHNVLGSGTNAIPDIVLNGGTLTPYQYMHMKNLTLNGGTVNNQNGTTDGMGLDFSDRNGTITSTGNSALNAIVNNNSTLTIDVQDGTLNVTQQIKSKAGKTVVKTGAGNLTTSSWINENTILQQGDLTITGNFGDGKRFNGTITVESGARLVCATHDSLGYGTANTKMYLNGGTLDNTVGNETLSNTQIYFTGGTANSTQADATLDILNDGVNFYSLATEGATPGTPTISSVNSKIRLRSNGTFEIDTEENSVLKFTKEIFTASGAGSITKTGDGVLELTAANTYAGGTTINGGTLKLSEAGTIGTGALTLNNGAQLDISQKTGPLNLNTISFNDLSVLKISIDKTNGVLSCPDVLVTTGDIHIAGTLDILLTGDLLGLGDVGELINVIDFATTSGTFSSITINPEGNQLGDGFSFIYNADTGTVELSIPEPSTWALLILGALGMMYFRRKK